MRVLFLLLLLLITAAPIFGQDGTASPTPEPIHETVVVTATREVTAITETPASVVSIPRARIAETAAPGVDDVLRQTPGFSIFRRSTSRTANPTTQGVSLRGLGSSGASRAIVLFDSVPLNDPFGGWVQWGRVAPVEIETIEVLRGGASSLYGDSGLSGAINVRPRKPAGKALSVDVFGGTQRTLSGSVFGGIQKGKWQLDTSASKNQVRGYVPIEEGVRGTADHFAGFRSGLYRTRLSRDFGPGSRLFFSPSYFGEARSNGTRLQINRTHIREFVFGGDIRANRMAGAIFRWRAFGGTQVFDQTFSVVSGGRNVEDLNRLQRVPVQSFGFSGQGSVTKRGHTFVFGADARNVRGSSDEIGIAALTSTSVTGAGGRQFNSGAFLHDYVRLGERVILFGGLRYDRWSNYNGYSFTRFLLTLLTTGTTFARREEDAFSPTFSALFKLTDEFSIYGNFSRSFRSPTLNDLYRPFRVGNIQTIANEDLKAERAGNVEGGLLWSRRRASVRASAFQSKVDGPVSNVTVSTTQNLILRQRRNAGEARARGLELEGGYRFDRLMISAGYLLGDSRVTSFPSDPGLVGRRIPQTARHQFTAQAGYRAERWGAAVQFRASSEQFDDDQNQFRLEPYSQTDISIRRKAWRKLWAYAAVENVFNSRYSIGRTPFRTVSAPAALRVGVKWQ